MRFEAPLPGVEGATYIDIIPASEPFRDDTWEKVWASLAYWVKEGTLKEEEAAAIIGKDVDGLQFTEMGRIVGIDPWRVRYTYLSGIKKLRKRYGVTLETVG